MPCTACVTLDILLGIGLMCQREGTLKGACVTGGEPFFPSQSDKI